MNIENLDWWWFMNRIINHFNWNKKKYALCLVLVIIIISILYYFKDGIYRYYRINNISYIVIETLNGNLSSNIVSNLSDYTIKDYNNLYI